MNVKLDANELIIEYVYILKYSYIFNNILLAIFTTIVTDTEIATGVLIPFPT